MRERSVSRADEVETKDAAAGSDVIGRCDGDNHGPERVSRESWWSGAFSQAAQVGAGAALGYRRFLAGLA